MKIKIGIKISDLIGGGNEALNSAKHIYTEVDTDDYIISDLRPPASPERHTCRISITKRSTSVVNTDRRLEPDL